MLDQFYRIAFCKNIHAAIGRTRGRKILDAYWCRNSKQVRTH